MPNWDKPPRSGIWNEYDSPLSAAIAQRDRSTLDKVTTAIRQGESVLAFQPVLHAKPPNQIGFYEGLIRVLDDTGRIIPPGDFMHQIEHSTSGRDLDCLSLDHGLSVLARTPSLRLAIKMSSRSIIYPRWIATLERHLGQNPNLGERLMLEISESSAMRMPTIVTDFMDNMQPHGIAFAMDRFGAGETSFRHFRDFFFDAIRIDGQFVRHIHADLDNQAMVRAMIALARQFDMLVIATSVAALPDAEYLANIGVDCLQGSLFGAPSLRPGWLTQDRQHQA